jgi:dUTP pyrophosphatase
MEKTKVSCAGDPGSIPRYQSEGAAGADLTAALDRDIVLAPGERVLVPTGIVLEIPPGFEGQIRPRSGLAVRHGVTVLNAPGTIDSDYRGEIKVVLINLGKESFVIKSGERIAQIVLSAVTKADFIHGGGVAETKRGSGGFGSTG